MTGSRPRREAISHPEGGPARSLAGLFRHDRVEEDALVPSRPLDPSIPTHLFLALGNSASKPVHEKSASKRPLPIVRKGERSANHARPEAEPLPIGGIVDKYRIEEVLGTGGFAVVYRATHLLLHRPVAIKLLRSKVLERRPELAERLCEEARFAARINHPNVVRVFDVTHETSITYVVLEYIEGITLARRIRERGRLSVAEILTVAIDVTRGLRAGLDQGLIHRDIKPHNILLSSAGETKIVDLGLARSLSSDAQKDDRERPHSIVGTYGYMAPEQAQDAESVDFRSDIYSLGATMFHAAVGVPPFPTDDSAQCLRMHASSPVPLPERIIPGIPPAFSRLVLWMLSKKPEQRPASYDVLEGALSHARAALARNP